MTKARIVYVAVGALAAGVVGCTAQVDPSGSGASTTNQDLSAAQSSPSSASPDEARIADATQKLDGAFADQFVKGQIDRDALAPLIDAVVQATPEEERSMLQSHIDDVIALAQEKAPQMTAEQRAQLARPPTTDGTGKTQIEPWGWGGGWGHGGWGGWGGGWGGWGGRGWGGGWGGGWGFPGWGGGWGGGWGFPGWGGGWGWGRGWGW